MLLSIRKGDVLCCLACEKAFEVGSFIFDKGREGIKCPKCDAVFDTHLYHIYGKCLSEGNVKRGGGGMDIDLNKRLEGDLYDITIHFYSKNLKRKHRHKDELYLSEVRLLFLKKIDSWKIESCCGRHIKIIPYKSIKYISASPALLLHVSRAEHD